jgi:Ca2+-binding EF-hand superfamily protein
MIVFDNDHNGYIDFREFVCGLCLMQKQENINDPLMKMLFRAYDLDNNGFISKEEVFKIFKHYKLMKGEFIGDQNLIAMVNQVFSQVDFDNDEQLNFSEFKSAVMRGLVIVRMV